MQILVAEIHPNPLQPRSKKPVVTDLVTSMAKVGLVQPIVVAKNGKGYNIIAGHRRFAAAQALDWKTIECDVVDLSNPKLDIGRIMAENEVRENLSGAEKLAGYQTMIDLGYTDEEMVEVSGAEPDEIAAVRKVAEAPKKVITSMPKQATLEEMAALAEFSKGDEHKTLLGVVGTDNFAHTAERLRQERQRRAKVEAAHKLLKDNDVRLISREDTYYGKALRLSDGRLKLDIQKHTECPGHCAFVEYYGEIIYCCDHLDEHGIQTHGRGAKKTDEEKALDKRKREMRALWRASTSIRQQFAVAKVNLKKPDTKLVKWALDYATTIGIPGFDGYNVGAKGYTESKDGLIRFLAICVWQVEKAIDDWVKYQGAVGQPARFQQEYLAMLVELKYPASDHELAVVAGKEYVPPAN